jgi:thymidylate kinase
MTTVALVGLDGAGKTTLARRLEQTLPVPARYVYLGVNREASTHLLPTTRLIRSLRRARRAGVRTTNDLHAGSPASAVSAAASARCGRLWSAARFANRLLEEWFMQAVIWSEEARGRIVIVDRHYLSDFYGTDVLGSRRTLGQRLHAFNLTRLYPKPDLMVFLDAPPEVVFARKGEGTIDSLARRREEYLGLRGVVPRFVVVDADRPINDVQREVTDLVLTLTTHRPAEPRATA